MTVPVGVPDGLTPAATAVIVTLVVTFWGDDGVALVVTVVVPTPTADAGDAPRNATPATIKTDAAPSETTDRTLL